jgi:hypothetical protein
MKVTEQQCASLQPVFALGIGIVIFSGQLICASTFGSMMSFGSTLFALNN